MLLLIFHFLVYKFTIPGLETPLLPNYLVFKSNSSYYRRIKLIIIKMSRSRSRSSHKKQKKEKKGEKKEKKHRSEKRNKSPSLDLNNKLLKNDEKIK